MPKNESLGLLSHIRIPIVTVLILFLIIPLALVPGAHSLATSNNDFCFLCQNHESVSNWSAQVPSVNVSLDENDKQEGNASLKVTIYNETNAVGVAYDFGQGIDFSNGRIIIMWVKVTTIGMIRSLYLSIGDLNGNWRQYNDFDSWFALEPGRWTRVAIDPSHFVSQGSGFDLSQVRWFWLGAYDGGRTYNQKFWVDDISVQTGVEHSSSPSNSTTTLLPIWSAISNIVFLYVMTLPFGYLVTKGFKLNRFRADLGIAFLPILIALGFALEVIVLLASILVFMNSVLVWTVWIFAAATTAIFAYRSFKTLNPLSWSRSVSRARSLEVLGTLTSLAVPVYVLSSISSTLGLAPPNDSLIHSMIVSLVLANNHLGSTFSPISSIPLYTWIYSRGFYGLPSALSFSLGVYPAQSVMLVGAAIVALLPALFYSTTLIRTRSQLWAAIAFFMAFLLPTLAVVDSWAPSNDLMYGAFLVATYPSILGNLLLLTMFGIIILFDDFKPLSLRRSQWLGPFTLLTACLALTYYPYVLFSALYLVGREVASVKWIDFASRNGVVKLSLLALSVIGGFSLLGLARSYAISQISLNPDVQFQLGQKFNPLEPASPYVIYALLLALTVSLAVFSRYRIRNMGGRLQGAELFFGIMLGVHALSLSNETIHDTLLWMTNPSRSIIVLYALTFVMIPIYLAQINIGIPEAVRKLGVVSSVHPSRNVLPKFVSLGLIVLAFSPMILAPLEYSPSPSRPDILQLPHDGDYLATQWMLSNVDSHQLILNDISLSGLSLTSFRAFHVVNDMQRFEELYIFNTLPSPDANTMLDADRILQHPGDYDLVLSLMQKYGITYIYISNSSRTIGLFGSGVRFAPPITWTMTQAELLSTYSNNPNLRLAYSVGDSAIFETR